MIVPQTKLQPLTLEGVHYIFCPNEFDVHVNFSYCCNALISCWPGKSDEKEIFGSWKVTYIGDDGKPSYATYFIIRNGNDSTIRVHYCSWSGCTGIKETKVLPSADYYYSHTNGWFQVKNIHKANQYLFLKRESKEKLLVIWYGPVTGYKLTAFGAKGMNQLEKGFKSTLFWLTQSLRRLPVAKCSNFNSNYEKRYRPSRLVHQGIYILFLTSLKFLSTAVSLNVNIMNFSSSQ